MDEELDDMFGPIVSAPRVEVGFEPPDTVSSAAGSGADSNMQQSVPTSNLGDLATLDASSPQSEFCLIFVNIPFLWSMLQTSFGSKHFFFF